MLRAFMLHKPRGLVVSRADELGRHTVYHVLPSWARSEGWLPAGRLDKDSSGLLLFARDGRTLDLLTRPHHLEKEYNVVLRGHIQEGHVQQCLAGVRTAIGTCAAAAVTVNKVAHGKSNVTVVLQEGKNRHIRRMFGALQDEVHGKPLKVLQLRRVRVGAVVLDVPEGSWRWLTDDETQCLLRV